jgi:hypothetical protein
MATSPPMDTAPDDARGVLDAVATMLEPLAALLLMHELRFAQAEELLKAAFIRASARAYAAQGKVPSVSTLSVSTGMRRREVKRLVDAAATSRGSTGTAARRISPAAQARLRWTTDPRFLDAQGRPLRLPRHAPSGAPSGAASGASAGEVSFADLAATVSRDTHPRALLDELLRIGAVEEAGDHVVLRHRFQAPARDRVAKLDVGSANVSDHLWAMLVNLIDGSAPLMERAVFAEGLSQASARRAVELSRGVWSAALPRLREQLQELVDQDSGADGEGPVDGWRMRIGMYSWLAPQERPAPPIHARENRTAAAAKKAPRGSAAGSKPATASATSALTGAPPVRPRRKRAKPGDTT